MQIISRRISLIAFIVIVGAIPVAAFAQHPAPAAPRRQWVTVTVDRNHTIPMHFKEKPLEQLAGAGLGADRETADYRSTDGLTTVDVLEFRRRTRGYSIAAYPLGAGNGSSLMLRYGYETLPIVRFDIKKPDGIEHYALRDGRAQDFGIGLIVSDRSRGWGFGAHSFVVGGFGRLRGERGDGNRIFGEAGGGVNVGPVGFQLGIKIAYNKLSDPRFHNFFTIPISLRGTVSF